MSVLYNSVSISFCAFYINAVSVLLSVLLFLALSVLAYSVFLSLCRSLSFPLAVTACISLALVPSRYLSVSTKPLSAYVSRSPTVSLHTFSPSFSLCLPPASPRLVSLHIPFLLLRLSSGWQQQRRNSNLPSEQSVIQHTYTPTVLCSTHSSVFPRPSVANTSRRSRRRSPCTRCFSCASYHTRRSARTTSCRSFWNTTMTCVYRRRPALRPLV